MLRVKDIASQLNAEFQRRHARNARYSLRAFARSLDVDHATLSQWMRGRRAITRTSAEKLREVLDARVHDAVLDLTRRFDFRPDARWIARTLDVPVDEVTCALQKLIRLNRRDMANRDRWVAKGASA